MSDWNLVQIYCDEMGGIDENDLMIEVRGNKEERENLISQLLQRMKSKYKDGGEVGENKIDFKNFTIAEFNSFVKSINAYGDISVSVSEGNNVNKEGTYTKKIDLKKLKDLSMSLGDGKEISVITGSENIYADVVVYDNNYDKGYKEYTISLFSKDDKKGLKSIVNAIIEKFKNGGGIDINELNMPVIRTQFEDEEYEFKDGGEVGNEDVLKVAKAIFDNNNKKGKIKTSFGDKTFVGLKAMIENTNYDSEEIASSIFSVNEKKGKISTSFGDKYYGGLLAMINHARANKLKYYNLGQMAEGGTTKGFSYTIGGL